MELPHCADDDFLCAEDRTCLNGDAGDAAGPDDLTGVLCAEDRKRMEDDRFVLDMTGSSLSETEEYIRFLISRERSVGSAGDGGCSGGSSGGGNWLRRARSGAVRWILEARVDLHFSLQCAYVSVAYLDRFLLRRTIDMDQPWVMDLLSVACLSLAAKMEEIRVPPLLEFPAGKYYFDCKTIQRMELLVLNTLDWRMNMSTPFNYLSFLASKLAGEVAGKELLFRAVSSIFSTIEGTNLVDFRPSAIAAAAIFAASETAPTETSIEKNMAIIFPGGSLEIGDIISCYKTIIQSAPGPGAGRKRSRESL